MPSAAATAYTTPSVASGETLGRAPPPTAKKTTPSSVTTSESAIGCVVRPPAIPLPARKSASAMPAEESSARAAPTKTMRRSTT